MSRRDGVDRYTTAGLAGKQGEKIMARRRPHYLYRFSRCNGDGEFVVISDDPPKEVIAKYAGDDIQHDGTARIEDDATAFPCDRSLRA